MSNNTHGLPSWGPELVRRVKAGANVAVAARALGISPATANTELRNNRALQQHWLEQMSGARPVKGQRRGARPGAAHGRPAEPGPLVPSDELLRYENMSLTEWQNLSPAKQYQIMKSYLPAQQQRSTPAAPLRSDGHLTRAERVARQQHQIRVGRAAALGNTIAEGQQRQQGKAVRQELAELRERLKNKKERDRQRLY
jgi:hypothetical protein